MDLTITHGNLKTIFKIVLLSMSIGKSRRNELGNMQQRVCLLHGENLANARDICKVARTLPPEGEECSTATTMQRYCKLEQNLL